LASFWTSNSDLQILSLLASQSNQTYRTAILYYTFINKLIHLLYQLSKMVSSIVFIFQDLKLASFWTSNIGFQIVSLLASLQLHRTAILYYTFINNLIHLLYQLSKMVSSIVFIFQDLKLASFWTSNIGFQIVSLLASLQLHGTTILYYTFINYSYTFIVSTIQNSVSNYPHFRDLKLASFWTSNIGFQIVSLLAS